MLSSFSPPILSAVPDLSSMADKKMSKIILDVDLDCSGCFKKITETLEKFPDIQTQILNREKKTVIISGPFDPEKLMKCICCKAGKYIPSYKIVPPPPPTPTPTPPPPPPPIKPPPSPPPPPPPPPCNCCRCCRCCHGWAAQPCPAPICVCLCFEGYKAVPWSSPYAPLCGCREEESTCRIM